MTYARPHKSSRPEDGRGCNREEEIRGGEMNLGPRCVLTAWGFRTPDGLEMRCDRRKTHKDIPKLRSEQERWEAD